MGTLSLFSVSPDAPALGPAVGATDIRRGMSDEESASVAYDEAVSAFWIKHGEVIRVAGQIVHAERAAAPPAPSASIDAVAVRAALSTGNERPKSGRSVRRGKRPSAAEENARRTATHELVGSTPYTDDMSSQGWIEFSYYTHGAADLTHALRCPGCDPSAESKPKNATWLRIEKKWIAKGDPPRCPVRHSEWSAARATVRNTNPETR